MVPRRRRRGRLQGMSKPETFTLRLETELLEQARRLALARGKPLSALMRDSLRDLVGGRRPRSRRSSRRY